ncbi:YD repeat-containing domain protein [Escherichia coli P0304816.2]|nr:YD repeat-containing domain protein [Escherichia coli P0304816.2]
MISPLFTLREFSGQVILVTLRPAIKARCSVSLSPGHTERGLAAVLLSA